MKKNRGKYIRENVVMFPGTVERLFSKAHEHAEKLEYDLAASAFEEALKYEEADEQTLSMYAYSLYETRQFEKAKEVTESLLVLGPSKYIEVMELYLSICMELRDFQHVQQIIRSLLEERIVPEQSIDKFESILRLSEKLSHLERGQEHELAEEVEAQDYKLENFKELPLYVQMRNLQSLTNTNIRPLIVPLIAIIEADELHPIVRSIALYLLVEQEVDATITIGKFKYETTVNPRELALPDEMPIAAQVFTNMQTRLERETNTLEMVQYLLARHILVTYPFEWFNYSADEVTAGYIDYVHSLFGELEQPENEFSELIKQLEKFSELPEV